MRLKWAEPAVKFVGELLGELVAAVILFALMFAAWLLFIRPG